MQHPAILQPTILSPAVVLYKPRMNEQIRQRGHAEVRTCPIFLEPVHRVLLRQRINNQHPLLVKVQDNGIAMSHVVACKGLGSWQPLLQQPVTFHVHRLPVQQVGLIGKQDLVPLLLRVLYSRQISKHVRSGS